MKKIKGSFFDRNGRRAGRSIFAVPVGVCILFLLLGAVLGGIAAFECLYLGSDIAREEAIPAEGVFDSYELLHSARSGNVTEVRIRFLDREELYLTAYHEDMDEGLEALMRGERLYLLLHPYGGDIWEISSERGVLLSFEDARERIQIQNGVFGAVLCTVSAICVSMSVISLVMKCAGRKRNPRETRRSPRELR